jgi:thiamine biosynthesis protein ThiS
MKVLLNNKSTFLDDGLTIKSLLNQIDMKQKYFAVEVNEQIVPKSNYDIFLIKEGDKIEIVTAIGGG